MLIHIVTVQYFHTSQFTVHTCLSEKRKENELTPADELRLHCPMKALALQSFRARQYDMECLVVSQLVVAEVSRCLLVMTVRH